MDLPVVSPVKHRAKKYIGMYLALILFILSFGMGFLVGQQFLVKSASGSEGGIRPAITQVTNLNRLINHSDSVDFNQFWEVWDRIKAKYVKEGIKDTDLFYGAIQGLTMSLGDPYSVYFPPKAARRVRR